MIMVYILGIIDNFFLKNLILSYFVLYKVVEGTLYST